VFLPRLAHELLLWENSNLLVSLLVCAAHTHRERTYLTSFPAGSISTLVFTHPNISTQFPSVKEMHACVKQQLSKLSFVSFYFRFVCYIHTRVCSVFGNVCVAGLSCCVISIGWPDPSATQWPGWIVPVSVICTDCRYSQSAGEGCK